MSSESRKSPHLFIQTSKRSILFPLAPCYLACVALLSSLGICAEAFTLIHSMFSSIKSAFLHFGYVTLHFTEHVSSSMIRKPYHQTKILVRIQGLLYIKWLIAKAPYSDTMHVFVEEKEGKMKKGDCQKSTKEPRKKSFNGIYPM